MVGRLKPCVLGGFPWFLPKHQGMEDQVEQQHLYQHSCQDPPCSASTHCKKRGAAEVGGKDTIVRLTHHHLVMM